MCVEYNWNEHNVRDKSSDVYVSNARFFAINCYIIQTI